MASKVRFLFKETLNKQQRRTEPGTFDYQSKAPTTKLLQPLNLNYIPYLQVTFPNGHATKLILIALKG